MFPPRLECRTLVPIPTPTDPAGVEIGTRIRSYGFVVDNVNVSVFAYVPVRSGSFAVIG